MASGERFVMMDGLIRMQLWYVDNLATSKRSYLIVLKIFYLVMMEYWLRLVQLCLIAYYVDKCCSCILLGMC